MVYWISFSNPTDAIETLREASSSKDRGFNEEDLASATLVISNKNYRRSPCAIKTVSQQMFDRCMDTSDMRQKTVLENFDGKEYELKDLYQKVKLRPELRKPLVGIALVQDGKSETYRQLVEHASTLIGYKLEYIELILKDRKLVRGIRFEACHHEKSEIPRRLGFCDVQEVFGVDRKIAIPLHYRSPVVDRYGFLFPNMQTTEMLVWHGDVNKGSWIKGEIKAEELADQIEFKFPANAESRFIGNSEDIEVIQVRIVQDRQAKQKHVYAKQQVIESISTKEGRTESKLLNLLDYIETGEFRDATYFVQRQYKSSSPMTDLWHYIKYDERRNDNRNVFGSKRYIQPAHLKEYNIFLEEGYRFQPDISNLISSLQPMHPLRAQFIALREQAGDDSVHIIECSTQSGSPRIRTLDNPLKLIDCLDGIDELNRRIEPTNSVELNDLLVKAGVELKEFRKKREGALLNICKGEEKHLLNECDEALALLAKVIAESEQKGIALQSKKEIIKNISLSLEKSILTDAPNAWITLLKEVLATLTRLAAQRNDWIQEQKSALDTKSTLVKNRQILLKEIADSIDKELTTLQDLLRSCKSLKSDIDTKAKVANEAEKTFENLDLESKQIIEKSSNLLIDWKKDLDVKNENVKQKFIEIQAEDGRLSEIQTSLDIKTNEIASRENELASWRREQEAQKKSNDARIKENVTEQKRIEHIRDVEIPDSQKRLTRVTNTVEELKSHGYDDMLQSLNSEISTLESKEASLTTERNAVKRANEKITNKKEDLRKGNSSLSKEIEDLELIEKEILELEHGKEKLENTLAEFDPYLRQKLRKLKNKKSELEVQISEKNDQKNKVAEVKQQVIKLQKSLEEIEEEVRSGPEAKLALKTEIKKAKRVYRRSARGLK